MDGFNYYYIFGVRLERKEDLTPKISLDFMIEYNDNDVDNCNLAQAMIENELFPTTNREATEACNLKRIGAELQAAKFMISANNLTVHKIKSDIPLDREDLHSFVDVCNYSKESLKKLKEAEIRI